MSSSGTHESTHAPRLSGHCACAGEAAVTLVVDLVDLDTGLLVTVVNTVDTGGLLVARAAVLLAGGVRGAMVGKLVKTAVSVTEACSEEKLSRIVLMIVSAVEEVVVFAAVVVVVVVVLVAVVVVVVVTCFLLSFFLDLAELLSLLA